jgi:hypothetical protein
MIAFTQTDKRIIGNLLIVSGILALASIVVGLVAVDFDFDAFANPLKLLEMQRVNTGLIRWFLIFDLFGYYLLLLPFVFYAREILSERTPWSGFFTSMGFSYVLIGAIGAAALSVVWPSLIEQYYVADPSTQQVIRGDFSLSTDFVVKGLWNHLEVLLGGVWWISLSVFMFENKALKFLTFGLGAACLLDSAGEFFMVPIVAELGLNLYIVLGIVWPIWVGVKMRKGGL